MNSLCEFKNLFKGLIVMFIIFSFVSCDRRMNPIRALEEVSHDLETNSSHYNEDDWQAVERSLIDISNELDLYRQEYTDEELVYIGKLKGKCAVYIGKHELKNAIDESARNVLELFGAFKGVTETLSNELIDSI